MDYNNPDPEFWYREVRVKLDVLTLMAVHGNLLLALRHPQNIGVSRDMVVSFVKQVGDELVSIGAMTDEMLKETYRIEVENGNAEFLEELNTPPKPDMKHRASSKPNFSSGDLEILQKPAKCCNCGCSMTGSFNVNIVALNKKATWKKPVWDNMLLKPGIERIPRALAVVCDTCIDAGTQPVEAIEMKGNEILYHNITDLEDAFEITPDMVVQNIKDLRG